MTKNEFIIEYTLRHGKNPTFDLIDQLQRWEVFSEESVATPETHSSNNACGLYRGCKVVLLQPVKINSAKTLPAGFVFKVTNFYEFDDSEYQLNIMFSLYSKNKVSNEKHTLYIYNLDDTISVIKESTPLSVLQDIQSNPRVYSDGRTRYEHEYIADKTTLIKV